MNRDTEEQGQKNPRTLGIALIQFLNNLNSHAIRSADNGLTNGLQRHVLAIRIGLLDFSDLVNVLEGERGGDHVAWAAAPGVDPGGFLQVPSDRRRLDGELEGVVLESRNGDGHGCVGLVLLGPGIEIFAERHKIQPILTERRTHRRRWAGSAGRHSEPDGGRDRSPG